MSKYIWQKPNWCNFKYDHHAVMAPLARARRAQGSLLGRMSLLDMTLGAEAQASVLVEEAVRTAEIEGMILNRDAVRSSVAVRLGLPHGVTIKDRNVDGLVDVLLDAMRNHDARLTLARLNGWQAALFPTGYFGFKEFFHEQHHDSY